MTKNPPTSKAPFDWNELLAEAERVNPTGNGMTIEEVAEALGVWFNRASKIVKAGLANGKVERVTDIRMMNTGHMRRVTTFRFKGKKG